MRSRRLHNDRGIEELGMCHQAHARPLAAATSTSDTASASLCTADSSGAASSVLATTASYDSTSYAAGTTASYDST